jgi:ribosomal protein S18 acetylase RimI-like enzyme
MVEIRPTRRLDRARILAITRAEPLFEPDESAVVAELLDDYFGRDDHHGYYFLSAVEGKKLLGYACYGPTALTDGTFDLFWICVDRASARQGIGGRLLDEVEGQIADMQGRMIVLETSGRTDYLPTWRFYEKQGYTLQARIPEFYRPGEDLLIYAKRLDRQP